MDILKSLYNSNPNFIRDTLHLHFFKTALYYDERLKEVPRLNITGELWIALFMVDYASAYTVEDGGFKFELKSSFLGIPERIPFPLLFNLLIKECYLSNDIEDMFNLIYSSKNPILIRLAEQFKTKEISLSSELFDFLKRKECNTNRSWQLNEIKTGSWNYTLLTLNETVWDTAFDIKYLTDLFHHEKDVLDTIDEESLDFGVYQKYLINVDNIIHEKLS